jgi:hypothetical protein
MHLKIRFRGFSFQRIHADFKNEILFHKAKRFVRIVLFYSKAQSFSDGAHLKDGLHLSLMILFQQDQFFNSDKAACLQSIEIYAACK